MRSTHVLAILALLLSACSLGVPNRRDPQLFTSLSALCGKAFAGKLVSSDPQDASFAGQAMVMHVVECSAQAIRIPFHVGDDRSRTWVISKNDWGLRLKHEHRHRDGSFDALTNYGGDSALLSDTRAEFPADAESIALFTQRNRAVSNSNVWALDLGNHQFAYELRRAGRYFRVEFDLRVPVTPPAKAW
jgi:hypothetical protein